MIQLPVNQFNNTSWVAVVTPTDRPNTIHYRCVIKHFGDIFVLLLYSLFNFILE